MGLPKLIKFLWNEINTDIRPTVLTDTPSAVRVRRDLLPIYFNLRSANQFRLSSLTEPSSTWTRDASPNSVGEEIFMGLLIVALSLGLDPVAPSHL